MAVDVSRKGNEQFPVASPEGMLATCVPVKVKKRNMVAPTNSPSEATKSRVF